ncbi:ketopantoate reductase family protein [Poseidonocella sp. HB161398]|uniref:ketopantoate reductase family protein n=1 Tax=Poseidonocella sp. HB161398 TaxID=2320855 RepID=UPI001486F984|nr:ketopantoate reductase C-terminal domain-containing protein [Poseidonocella sp. HB161398]
MLFNSCMNPTAALTGPSFGGLLENPHSRLLVADLAQEALEVFAARGCRPEESGQVHVDGTLSRITFPGAAGHRSSMLQDIEARRRMAIDVLNGAIAEMARRAGLSFFRFIRSPCRSSITWMRR